jgi:putative iron-regulated protein
VTNALGIQNVYEGRYGSIEGPGIYDLVAARDTALADRLRAEIQASVDLAEAIPAPFDRAIVEHREAVEATVEALRTQADTIVEAAALLDIQLAIE